MNIRHVIIYRRMKKMVLGLIALSRPVNMFIAMISIFLAGVICVDEISWYPLLLAVFVGGMIAAAANAWNDFFDIEIDRINKPRRPLPSGKVTIRQALIFAGGSSVTALLLTVFIKETSFLIAFFALVLLFLYSAKLKGTVIWGNMLVGLITGVAFVFGATAVGDWQCALIPASFAFLMHFGREILKDMEDVVGDRTLQVKTLPIVYGFTPAKIVITALFGVLVIATLLPYFYGIYGRYYLVLVVIGVDPVLLYVIFKIWQNSEPALLHRLSELVKFDMFIGLLAIYCGRW